MLKLPKFPIRCKTKTGESFTALFKKTGSPTEIKVSLISKSKQSLVSIPAPKGEVLNWSAIAILAFEEAFPETKPKESPNVSNRPPMPLLKSKPIKKRNSQPSSSPSLLPEVPSPEIILVKNSKSDEVYRTAQSNDPAKHYLCRLEGGTGKPNEYALSVYFSNLREWTSVKVPGEYKLTINKETQMPTATKRNKTPVPQVPVSTPKPTSKNAPQAHSSNGLGIYEAWGKAFEANATKPNAPALISAFMEKSFPGRKTKWAKWVNSVRARYNAGKLPGVKAPTEKIKPYK